MTQRMHEIDYVGMTYKAVAEQWGVGTWGVNFSRVLVDGEAITGVTVAVIDLTDGATMTASMTSGTAAVTDDLASKTLLGGVAGRDYAVRFGVSTDMDSFLQGSVKVHVDDPPSD